MKPLNLIISLLLLTFTVSISAQNRIDVGEEAPKFNAYDIDGNFHDLEQMKGSVVVITFWSTKCEICRREFPHLNRLIESYRDKSVIFLSPTMEQEDKVLSFLRSNRIASRVLADSFGLILKYADNDGKGKLNMGFPSYFVIGPDSRVIFRDSGWNKLDNLRNAIDRTLRLSTNSKSVDIASN
jgi:peroxiredoxin